jgi:phosphohistidine swiveling domain-containing protein
MEEGYIMVAENTNPEFIYAFYKASLILVESSSELSHAAVTCKELDIPLAL